MESAPLTSAAESSAGMLRYDSFDGGGPMQSDLSAKRTCSEFASAVEWTATVSMPISRAARMMRSAISPRLAIRMRWNMAASRGLEAEEGLAVLHRAAVLAQHFEQAARQLGLDLVHQLHRLDDAEHLALLHHRAHVDEGRALGRRRAIEGADEGRV